MDFAQFLLTRCWKPGFAVSFSFLSAISIPGGAPTPPIVHITEILRNPTGGTVFEFVELFNAGDEPSDLIGARWDGIEFIFPPRGVMQPGEVGLSASEENPQSFATEPFYGVRSPAVS